MLHHQVHPLTRRDANNSNRMPQSMSMRQAMGSQQRPPHPHLMMGMQPPQPTSVMVPLIPPVMNSTSIHQQSTQGSDNEGIKIQGANNNNGVTSSNNNSPSHTPQQTQATETQTETEQAVNLTNTKEKTPMCLINELARFNKVTHQYRLTSETGPAHKKRFTVTLKLGDEEYTADGASIKKAQHTAAADALGSTRYEHPPPKTQRVLRVRKVNITPTVELNALAMKRGEPTSYNFLEPIPAPYPPNYFRGMSYQRYHYNKPMYAPAMFFVSLKVGEREFPGQGRTAQAARHDAAAKALHELRQLPLPEGVILTPTSTEETEQVVEVPTEPGSDLKSPISLVHELALKRNLSVTFEVVKEKGPPHMRAFLTSCRVGETVTEGEGNSKKMSKKRAAEKMLDELKKLPPVSPPAPNPQRLKRKPTAVKKKTRNLIKEPKAKQEYVDDINPISRLIQIQQAKKEREPEYTLIEERGVPRRREFVMEVTVGTQSCTGCGPNKKLAKRAAAEALLQLLGYSRPKENASANKSDNTSQPAPEKGRKVTFLDDADPKEALQNNANSSVQPGGSGGRQLVPGLLLMTDTSGFPGKGTAVKGPKSGGPTRQTAAVIAKELLSCGASPTAEAMVAAGHMHSSTTSSVNSQPTTAGNPRPKELLNYLSNLLKFSVQYTDFPKVNHSEFLSLVSLSINPPQVFHGAGPTTDASHDQAAHTALQVLSEQGLDTVNNNPDTDSKVSAGDGIYIMGGSKSTVTSNGK